MESPMVNRKINDTRYFTPVGVHWERLKELWNGN